MSAVVSRSRYPFAETRDNLLAAIEADGAALFAAIDQREASIALGFSLRPTVALLFGRVDAMACLVAADPFCGLVVPLKILVWEQSRVVYVAYVPAHRIVRQFRVNDLHRVIAATDAHLFRIVSSVRTRLTGIR